MFLTKLLHIKTGRKKRLVIGLIILLFLSGMAYASLMLRKEVKADWFNDAWIYRKKIPITAHTAAENNVYITITQDTSDTNKFQTDCGDIRFIKENGEILPYYLVSGCQTASTVIHVNFDTFPAGSQNIYLYYGNPQVTNGFSAADFSTAAAGVTLGAVGSEEKTTAPILYYNFDEGTNQIVDDMNQRNNGLLGTATYAESSDPTWKNSDYCISGGCLYFDGSDDIVTATNSGTIDLDSGLNSGFTISFWTRVMSDGENHVGQIISKGTNTYIRITNAGTDGKADIEASLDLATADATLAAVDAISLGSWQHIALIYSGSKITLYINGQAVNESNNGSGAVASDSSDLLIGGSSAANFMGFIDEFKIYNFTKSAAGIKNDAIKGAAYQGSQAIFGQSDKSFLTDGLIGYWKMDELTGNSCTGGVNDACDSSGSGFDGAWNGNAASENGKFDSSVVLDGSGDFISMGDPANGILDMDANQSFTLAAWIKRIDTSAVFAVMGKVNSGTDPGYWLLIDNSSNKLSMTVQDGTNSYIMTGSTPLGFGAVWYHVAAVIDRTIPTNSALYVNGKKESVSISGTLSTVGGAANVSPFLLGAIGGTGSYYNLKGNIDEARIYRSALSSTEVRRLAEWAPGPVAYWKMDEGSWTNDCSTDTVIDSSGNNFNGKSCPASTGPLGGDIGKFGNAGKFDDSDDYVITSGNSKWDSMQNVTASMWIRAGTPTATRFIFSKSVSTTDRWGFRWTNNNWLQLFDSIDDAGYTACQVGLTPGTWYYITGTLSSNGDGTFANQLYVNGISQNCSHNSTASWNSYAGDLYIGKDESSGTTFNGLIDDVKVYDYVRSQAQIIEDMNAGHPAGSSAGSAVGYWKFDESYGDTANNSGIAGSGSNGNLAGATTCPQSGDSACPSWTNDGKFGKGLSFSRAGTTDDYVDAGNNAALQLTTQGTVSAWVKSNANTVGNNPALVCTDDWTNNRNGYCLAMVDGQFVGEIADGSTADRTSSYGTTYDDNLWHHVVFTWDGSKLNLYVDAIMAAPIISSSKSAISNLYNVTFGKDPATNTHYFDGILDEVKIYNFALTEDQVKTEYNRGSSAVFGSTSTDSSGNPNNSASREFCVPGDSTACSAPVAYWKFDENNGNTAYDSSGNGMSLGQYTTNALPTWIFGKFGSAKKFNGVDTTLSASHNILQNPANNMTLSFWVNPASLPSDMGTPDLKMLIGKSGTGSANGWAWFCAIGNNVLTIDSVYCTWQNSSGTRFRAYSYNNGGTKLAKNVWQHIEFVRNGSSLKIYINGIERTALSEPPGAGDTIFQSLVSDVVYVGSQSSEYYFEGVLDDIKLYDYARTPAQIAWDYNRGAPIAWYKFDENTGSTANDSSGNDLTQTLGGGTAANQPAWNSGKFNTALNFDGNNDYSIASDNAIFSLGFLTISTWIKPDTMPNPAGSDYYILRKYHTLASPWSSYYLRIDAAGSQPIRALVANQAGTTAAIISNTAISPGNWYHVVVTWDGSYVRLYLNGQPAGIPVALSGTDLFDSDSNLYIGASGSSGYFDGLIDEVRIYNYALTPLQVKTLFNNDSSVRFQ